MGSSNKATSLAIFLLINCIVFVACPPDPAEIASCKHELSLEFKDGEPVDDFLHAILNIKLRTVTYNRDFGINEQIFDGNEDKLLEQLAKGYYIDLFYTLQDMNLPLLPTPKDYCTLFYRIERRDCIRNIEAIGCAANVGGIVCFSRIYVHWKKTDDPNAIPGTESLSEEELLEAINGPSSSTRTSSAENFLVCLSDDQLLDNYYKNNSKCRKRIKKLTNEFNYHQSRINEYGYQDYHRVLLEYHKQQQKDLHDARFSAYGIGNISYADLCAEYNRRQSEPKPFDKYYVLHLYSKMKSCGRDTFKTRDLFCERYLEQQSNQSSTFNFHMLNIF